jgi:hypothetical protein
MQSQTWAKQLILLLSILVCGIGQASQDSIGPFGINSLGLLGVDGQPLTGNGILIGQIEFERPGDADVGDSLDHRNTTVNPAAVYERTSPNPPPNPPEPDSNPRNLDGSHAEWVAGVMISTDASSTGVAPGALLYSAGYKPSGGDADPEAAIMGQLIASRTTPTGDKIHAVNLSFAIAGDFPDGNSLWTQFVDWSAADDDILYVQAGRESSTSPGVFEATDN